jgi:2-dehydro-3-deoxyphosphogluconate aldolase/(4S)-4-hydroxy-2-oxoglutarate aldolase
MTMMIVDYFENPQASPRPRLIPVIAIEDAVEAPTRGRTLAENGLPVAEITFRTKAAGAAIRHLAKLGSFLVGPV